MKKLIGSLFKWKAKPKPSDPPKSVVPVHEIALRHAEALLQASNSAHDPVDDVALRPKGRGKKGDPGKGSGPSDVVPVRKGASAQTETSRIKGDRKQKPVKPDASAVESGSRPPGEASLEERDRGTPDEGRVAKGGDPQPAPAQVVTPDAGDGKQELGRDMAGGASGGNVEQQAPDAARERKGKERDAATVAKRPPARSGKVRANKLSEL